MGTTVTVWAGDTPAFSSIAGFSSGFDIGGPLPRPLGRSKSAPPVVLNPGNRVVLNSGNQVVLNQGNWVGPNWGNSAPETRRPRRCRKSRRVCRVPNRVPLFADDTNPQRPPHLR